MEQQQQRRLEPHLQSWQETSTRSMQEPRAIIARGQQLMMTMKPGRCRNEDGRLRRDQIAPDRPESPLGSCARPPLCPAAPAWPAFSTTAPPDAFLNNNSACNHGSVVVKGSLLPPFLFPDAELQILGHFTFRSVETSETLVPSVCSGPPSCPSCPPSLPQEDTSSPPQAPTTAPPSRPSTSAVYRSVDVLSTTAAPSLRVGDVSDAVKARHDLQSWLPSDYMRHAPDISISPSQRQCPSYDIATFPGQFTTAPGSYASPATASSSAYHATPHQRPTQLARATFNMATEQARLSHNPYDQHLPPADPMVRKRSHDEMNASVPPPTHVDDSRGHSLDALRPDFPDGTSPHLDNAVSYREAVDDQGSPPRNALKKFICEASDECQGLTFDRKCEWKKHMDKHTRPYRCPHPECEKLQGFTYSGGLLRHKREVHPADTGAKELLRCPVPDCKRHTGKGFTRKENLNEHLRRVHPGVAVEHTPQQPHDPVLYKDSPTTLAGAGPGDDMADGTAPRVSEAVMVDQDHAPPPSSPPYKRARHLNDLSTLQAATDPALVPAGDELTGLKEEILRLRMENEEKDSRLLAMEQRLAELDHQLQSQKQLQRQAVDAAAQQV